MQGTRKQRVSLPACRHGVGSKAGNTCHSHRLLHSTHRHQCSWRQYMQRPGQSGQHMLQRQTSAITRRQHTCSTTSGSACTIGTHASARTATHALPGPVEPRVHFGLDQRVLHRGLGAGRGEVQRPHRLAPQVLDAVPAGGAARLQARQPSSASAWSAHAHAGAVDS